MLNTIQNSKKQLKKYGIAFAVILAAMFLCELFLFNFKWVHSTFDKELAATAENMVSGFTQDSDDLFTINEDTAVIEFNDINRKVKYLHFSPAETGAKAQITVSAVDEANAGSISAPTRTILSDVKASQYIRLHFSGNITNLKISIANMNGQTLNASSVILDAHVPLMFSWGRLLFMTLLLMLAYILKPGSPVYKYKTDLRTNRQFFVAALLLAAQIILFWNMIHWNPAAVESYKTVQYNRHYHNLVEAIKNGRLDLGEGSEELKALENPYDIGARSANNVSYNWDLAYYNGKYYCYFGIIPALLLYLPYNLITGNDLPNYIAEFLFSITIMAGIMFLLWEIIKKWYQNTPFVIYLLLSSVFSWTAALTHVIYKPDFYFIPSISALAFSILGLAFWMWAEQKKEGEEMTLTSWKLAAGSLCVALTAGCRPQFLITAFFGVILFWDCAFKKRSLFSKNSIKQTVAVCLPFIVIGLVTMWYNNARFHSPFDFGANYNLTSNDMTHRGFVFGRTGLGIFTYFLQPFRMNSIFPFIHDFGSETVYQGLTLTENLMGGALTLYPILLVSIYGVFQRKCFKNRCAYKMVLFSVIIAAVVAVLDAQMAGLLTRYFTDFVWLLMLASILTLLTIYQNHTGNKAAQDRIIHITVVLSAVTVSFAVLTIFAHTEYSIEWANPTLYYTMQHLVAFWM